MSTPHGADPREAPTRRDVPNPPTDPPPPPPPSTSTSPDGDPPMYRLSRWYESHTDGLTRLRVFWSAVAVTIVVLVAGALRACRGG